MAIIASNTAYAVLSTYDDAGKLRPLIVKFDISLQITGWIIIQGSGNNSLNPIDFVETSDGGFVVLAHRSVVGNVGPEDYLSLIKTTSTGTVVKQILFRLESSDQPQDLAQAPDGTLYVFGTTGSSDKDAIVLKFGSDLSSCSDMELIEITDTTLDTVVQIQTRTTLNSATFATGTSSTATSYILNPSDYASLTNTRHFDQVCTEIANAVATSAAVVSSGPLAPATRTP